MVKRKATNGNAPHTEQQKNKKSKGNVCNNMCQVKLLVNNWQKKSLGSVQLHNQLITRSFEVFGSPSLFRLVKSSET